MPTLPEPTGPHGPENGHRRPSDGLDPPSGCLAASGAQNGPQTGAQRPVPTVEPPEAPQAPQDAPDAESPADAANGPHTPTQGTARGQDAGETAVMALAARIEAAPGYCPACGRGDVAPTGEHLAQAQRETARLRAQREADHALRLHIHARHARHHRAIADALDAPPGTDWAGLATLAQEQRQRAERAEAEAARLHEAESADAAAGSYAHRAEYAALPAEAERVVGADVPALIAAVNQFRAERDYYRDLSEEMGRNHRAEREALAARVAGLEAERAAEPRAADRAVEQARRTIHRAVDGPIPERTYRVRPGWTVTLPAIPEGDDQ